MPRPLPEVNAAAATRRGSLHRENEDAFQVWSESARGVIEERGRLFAVCDGVSTAGAGRMAAKLTCERLSQFFEDGIPPNLDALIELVSEVDWELRGSGTGAACTLSALWLHGWTAHVLCVGDSPVYRLRKGKLRRAEATAQGKGKRLRAYLGMGPSVADVLCVTSWRMVPGDVFIVASDGLTNVVKERGLRLAWERSHDPDRCAQSLISAVASGDGEDDATAVVVEVGGVDVQPGVMPPQEAPDPPEYLAILEEDTGAI